MIAENLLSRGECADCRECCVFFFFFLSDTPVITDEVMRRVRELDPERRFAEFDGRRLFVMDKEPDSDYHFCPMLDRERGCRLGEDKPFDCRIFPLRIMELAGRRVIAVSPVCPVISGKPFGRLLSEARRLAPVIFAEADRCPQIIRQYITGYPVLVIE